MVDTSKMAACSSKRTVSEEIIDILLLDIEQETPISVINDNTEQSKELTNVVNKPEDSSQRVNVDNNLAVAVPVPVFVPVSSVSVPVSVSVPAVFKKIDNWGKSLKGIPTFTIKEIEQHRLKCGKTPESAIIKTLDRGRKFKEERYISADNIFTSTDSGSFYFQCKCKASMKKDFRKVFIKLSQTNGEVQQGYCTCPAGLSGYCNHVMALLLEVADYSLNQLKSVPEEITCTSRLRQWGIPGVSSSNFHSAVQLPFCFYSTNDNFLPNNCNLSDECLDYIKSITVTAEESILLETETVDQAVSDLWFNVRRNKITSSNAH